VLVPGSITLRPLHFKAPLLISQPIKGISGEVRPCMVNRTLSLRGYWLAEFLVDFVLWLITVTVLCAAFLAAQIVSFYDTLFNVWHMFVIGGRLSSSCCSV